MKNILCLIIFMLIGFPVSRQEGDLDWKPSVEIDKVWSLRQLEELFNGKKVNENECTGNIDVFVLDWYGTYDDTTTAARIRALKDFYNEKYSKKIRLVSYLSGGTYEYYRPDTASFSDEVIGNRIFDKFDENSIPTYWPGEKWLDFRRLDILKKIMEKRVKLAKKVGFDGIEWDNIDISLYSDMKIEHSYCGFEIKLVDQLKYNKTLANITHKHGLAVGLKNNIEQLRHLHEYYDFAMNEEMYTNDKDSIILYFHYFSNEKYKKPVINIEYDCDRDDCKENCDTSIHYNIYTIYKTDYFGVEDENSRCN